MNNNFERAPRFFAAANGVTGFRSYFDEIFSSEHLTGVYILKGGPGTGKSTLLKELARHFACPEIQQQIFLCSSDPDSLDGLLLMRGERRVAILDGTAPHERDARLPGATDILINLGDGFDVASLREQKVQITDLQKKKSTFYKDAYFYLGLFGIFQSKIVAEAESRLNKAAVSDWMQELNLSESDNTDAALCPRLIRSFSREGISRLDTYETAAKRKIAVLGESEECEILLSSLYSSLKARQISGWFSPSPFFTQLSDGLYLKKDSLSITSTNVAGSSEIFARDFFSPRSAEAKKRTEEFRSEAERYLALAREALAEASKNHFALEKIYTPAVDFAHINSIRDALKKEIGSLL